MTPVGQDNGRDPIESPNGAAPRLMLADGRPESVIRAHEPPGFLHMAVSVQLLTLDGQWLLQRRSLSKRLFAGRWANSCCTHPAPSEAPAAAASRRLSEELGVVAVPLFPAGTFTYRATDPASGMVEHEHDHVFVGFTDLATVADPSEIEALWCGSFEEAMAMTAGADGAPWAGTVLRLAANRACALLPYLRRNETLKTQVPSSPESPRLAGQWS
jgi:isopentenyl-diphosphate Delta-isomerase